MISVATALQQILAQAAQLPAAEVETGAALGQILAADVASDIDSPPWDKSLVDGYAVRASDVASSGAELTVVEEVTAGRVATREVVAGTCTRIMTGAPLPSGADAVIMIERSEMLSAARVRLNASAQAGQNILRRAASMARGQVVLHRGQTIRPIEVGVLAEVGQTRVKVVQRPRVAILSTGDELINADQVPTGGQIRNSNGPMLAALVTAAGAEPITLGIATDDELTLRRKMAEGLSADLLVLSGGVSAGVLDLVPQTLARLGVQEVFHKVNLKPGKPLWFGVRTRDDGARTLVVGLPGNPVSTLVCYGLFVKPALAKLAGGGEEAQVLPAQLTQDFQQRDARPTYFPARRVFDGHGYSVTPLAWRGSADLRTLADANCLAYFPGGEQLFVAGQAIETYSL